ncbi:MAG: ATP-binding cassette domain-containing protein, partial [Desulfobacteraceae bacterium]|nr:ATP-binding cassette domain-containing protein [Desulfobacteraceae bacterium]
FIKSSAKKREIIHGMGLTDNICGNYIQVSKESIRKNSQAEKVKSAISACINFISIITCSGIFCYGAVLFFESKVTEGTLIGIFVIAMRIFYPLEKVAESSAESIKALAAFKRLKNYIVPEPETEKFELPQPAGALSFENVIYSLNGKPVLRNITFSLEPGESLVIIGPSASGKTLLSRLALGIIEPASGKIRIDGAEISHWDKKELGKYTGYLPSRKLLFEGRVDENISGMDIPDSDKVVNAAKKACAHDMILKLPEGYNTNLSEDGYNISSSQSQLISIARAIYDEPKLVVMDCPHNDLDDRGLKNFILTMQALKQQKTTLVAVSDRPAIAVNADKILVLQDGQISIFGPAKEVLSKLTNS